MKLLKHIVLGLIILSTTTTYSQILDIRNDRHKIQGAQGTGNNNEKQFEWLNSGRFGFNGDLSVQSTAQILRYRIGEPNGFNIPLYILTTVTDQNTTDTEEEQVALNNILNPTAGLFNSLFANSIQIAGKEGKKSTLSIIYGLGYKLISAKSNSLQSRANISTIYTDAGIRFVTGAWVDGDQSKYGTFGIQLKGFFTSALNNQDNMKLLFGPDTKSYFAGISGDIIIFISNEIDLRLNISRALSQKKIDEKDLTRTVVNFSVNYSRQ